jgi:peroxiredoxin
MRTFTLLAAIVLGTLIPATAGELSGRRAPGFSLPDSKMRQHDLGDYRGKVVLIDIIQTSCPHCRTFAGILEQVKAKYAARVAVLTVVNPPDTLETVQKYIADLNVSTPVLFDCGQMAASYLKITPERPKITVPHLFLIDAQGMIADDYGYSAESKEIFEGKGIFPLLDKMLAAATKR